MSSLICQVASCQWQDAIIIFWQINLLHRPHLAPGPYVPHVCSRRIRLCCTCVLQILVISCSFRGHHRRSHCLPHMVVTPTIFMSTFIHSSFFFFSGCTYQQTLNEGDVDPGQFTGTMSSQRCVSMDVRNLYLILNLSYFGCRRSTRD